MRSISLITALLAGSFSALAGPADPCRTLQHHGELTQAKQCFSRLLETNNPLTRAEGYFGLLQYENANEEFREADRLQPKSALVKTEWGRLYSAHAQPGDAAKLFEEAIEADPNYAPAYLELARVLGQNYDEKAIELSQKALQLDPKLVAAHEFLAYLALEDSDEAVAAEEAQKALSLSSESLDAMAVLASMDWLKGNSTSSWMERILKINPVYGEAYATAAHFLVINYRYEDGIAFYRKALALNPALSAARSQLGVNLLRLGHDSEARQELVRCYNEHFRDPETLNALRFLDKVNDFTLIKSGNIELLLDKKEAALLAPYIEPELKRAMATYERKYQMKLTAPVRIELYPNAADFQVRTLGLPAQIGLLGVTFGTVVAMQSPSAAPPGEFNWDDTMWHELSHVYVVTETHSLVPRWFTEGLAVHEEHVASPAWGDRLTPDIIEAVRAHKLLPVQELDRGFVRPKFPGQVQVSYYEAGQICDYITEKWSDAAILGMIKSYAVRHTTAEAIQENLHVTPGEFDKSFAEWLNARTGTSVQHFDEWKKQLKQGYADLANGKQKEAADAGLAALKLYPEYVGRDSGYELLATVHIATGKKQEAATELEKYRDLGGSDVETLKKLAQLEQGLGNKDQMRTTLQMLGTIYPEDAGTHRDLGDLLLNKGDAEHAIREYQAVLALHPGDVAQAHFDLARALEAAHRKTDAKDEVLLALEAAPDYKPAQHLLLELSQ